jgi:hypothetical protein
LYIEKTKIDSEVDVTKYLEEKRRSYRGKSVSDEDVKKIFFEEFHHNHFKYTENDEGHNRQYDLSLHPTTSLYILSIPAFMRPTATKLRAYGTISPRQVFGTR